MNDIKLWSFTLCAAALAATFIDLLSPKRMKNTLGVIIRLFLLLCLISPLARLPSLLPTVLNISPPVEITPLDVSSVAESAARKKIEELIADKLAENGIMPSEIRIDITMTEQSLAVNSVSIMLENKDESTAESVRKIIKESFGLEAETV